MIRFVTGSQNKFEEVRALLPDILMLEMDLPEIQEIDARKIIEEKLRVALEREEGPLMVEDTSLYLECLGGLPGPLVKWFHKTMASEGIAKMAAALGDTRATALTIIGYANTVEDIHFFEGKLEGKLVLPRVKSGFGWDDIFVPEGQDRTMAEMTKEEKHAISMRGIAVIKLKQYLDEQAV